MPILAYRHVVKIFILLILFLSALSFRAFFDDSHTKPGLIFSSELIIINLSLLMMGGLLRVLSKNQIEKICNVLLLSGVIVSIFSMYEIFFLSHLYQEYWIRTEGMRSVSSLLNPNNCGVYIGACIVLLFSSTRTLLFKISLGLVFLFPWILSGSRTAWVCVLATLAVIGIRNSWKNPKNALILFSTLVCLIFIPFWVDFAIDIINGFGYDLASRISDDRSSTARLDKYMEFLLNFNVDYFFPDFYNENIVLVSESSYFTYLNYLGIFGCILFFYLVFWFYKIHITNCFKNRILVYIFLYYIFVGFFESVITSFPNNQLFFISAGSFLVFRGVDQNKILHFSRLNYENNRHL